MRWLLATPGIFKTISFQPIAQVGRTAPGLGGGVDVEALWRAITDGLCGAAAPADALLRHQQWLGHPACSRFVQGVIVGQDDASPRFVVLTRFDDARDRAAMDAAMRAFGGATTRGDGRLEAWTRSLALLVRHPWFLLRHALPWLWRLARRLRSAPVAPRLAAAARPGAGRLPQRRQPPLHERRRSWPRRRDASGTRCVANFKVAIDDRLVSMCEANAAGRRAAFYERLRRDGAPDGL